MTFYNKLWKIVWMVLLICTDYFISEKFWNSMLIWNVRKSYTCVNVKALHGSIWYKVDASQTFQAIAFAGIVQRQIWQGRSSEDTMLKMKYKEHRLKEGRRQLKDAKKYTLKCTYRHWNILNLLESMYARLGHFRISFSQPKSNNLPTVGIPRWSSSCIWTVFIHYIRKLDIFV